MNRLLPIAALLAATTLAAGCTGSKTRATTPMNTVENADKEGLPREVWIDKIIVSSILAEKVHVASVYEGWNGDLKRIQLNVQNDSGRSIHVKWRVDWYDEEGFEVDTPTASWRNITLSKGQRLSLKSSATSPRALDWRFSVQESAL